MVVFRRIIAAFLTAVITKILFEFIFNENEKEYRKSKKNPAFEVKLPKAILGLGIFGCVFTAGVIVEMYLSSLNGEIISIGYYIGVGIFSLLPLSLIYAFFSFRIRVFKSENYFIYRTAFFKTNKVNYDECISLKMSKGGQCYILKTKNKRFFIDYMSLNSELFVKQAIKHKIPFEK